MRTAILAGVLAVAAACATLAGGGLAVAPHVDPPGTPRFHDHVLAAYRYPAFLLRMAARLDHGPRFGLADPAVKLAAGLTLAVLVRRGRSLVRRGPRRRMRPDAPGPAAEQWRPASAVPPPRRPTLLASA